MGVEALRSRIAAGVVLAALALTVVHASPASAVGRSCPVAADIHADRDVTPTCVAAIYRYILDPSPFFEGDKKLEVATYQKELGLPLNGVLDAVTARHLLTGGVVHVSTPVHHRFATEFLVDKHKQVAYDIVRGQVTREVSVSTGTERYYADRSQFDGRILRGVANTPVGAWSVFRRQGANYQAPLGPMRYPDFYDRGWAVHGGEPVSIFGRQSHGCVRVSDSVLPLLQADLGYGRIVEVIEHL